MCFLIFFSKKNQKQIEENLEKLLSLLEFGFRVKRLTTDAIL